MRILIRMPNWLGDAVMATPAVDRLRRHFPDGQLVLVGSPAVSALLRGDPAFHVVAEDTSKQHRFRPLGIRAAGVDLRHRHGPFDLAFAFPNSVSSRLLVRCSGARRTVGVRTGLRSALLSDAISVDRSAHQAVIYDRIVKGFLGHDDPTGPTRLHVEAPHRYPRPTIGINPGAAYGSAKRWEPERFAEVAASLSDQYDLILFGGPGEVEMTGQIEASLVRQGVTNFENIAGRTNLKQLPSMIAGLELFITNDSGPMHVAGALGIATVAIFGPTNHIQTHPWRNPRSILVRHDLDCAPCMQRTCPLKHHACMRDIQASEVIQAALALLTPGSEQSVEAA